ncbi:alpha/beta hydrolase [Candidatus Hydrogenedentota bacterium]
MPIERPETLRWLFFVIKVVFIAYVGLLVLVYVVQGHLLYIPSRNIAMTPATIGLEYEQVILKSADDVKISSWFVPVENSKGTILFCHGNAGNISHRLDTLEIFSKLGFSTLIFDYRGYGESKGKPTEKGTYDDAMAAWDYLRKERDIPSEDIVIFGRSLGGAVAAWIAARTEPRALVLESTFTSVPDLAGEVYPFLPGKLLCRFSYDTEALIGRMKCPVLVVHSPEDDIIPFSHGEALFTSASTPKEFLRIRGDHNTGFLTSGEKYSAGIVKFLVK